MALRGTRGVLLAAAWRVRTPGRPEGTSRTACRSMGRSSYVGSIPRLSSQRAASATSPAWRIVNHRVRRSGYLKIRSRKRLKAPGPRSARSSFSPMSSSSTESENRHIRSYSLSLLRAQLRSRRSTREGIDTRIVPTEATRANDALRRGARQPRDALRCYRRKGRGRRGAVDPHRHGPSALAIGGKRAGHRFARARPEQPLIWSLGGLAEGIAHTNRIA
jgi:hypothetical protein